MKTYKVKDQEEAVKNAKLFYETVKLAWGLQVTYCYHDLIHMIKNDLCYDLYDSDDGWGMGLGAKNQNDADVCTLAEILKEDDDDEDDASKKEEKERILIMIMKPKLLMREKRMMIMKPKLLMRY